MKPPNAEPTPEPETEVDLISPLAQHRIARFAELGFTAVDAAVLAHTKDDDGFPLYHGKVARLQAYGCTHEQVLRIYA